jgi:hypothetical protein
MTSTVHSQKWQRAANFHTALLDRTYKCIGWLVWLQRQHFSCSRTLFVNELPISHWIFTGKTYKCTSSTKLLWKQAQAELETVSAESYQNIGKTKPAKAVHLERRCSSLINARGRYALSICMHTSISAWQSNSVLRNKTCLEYIVSSRKLNTAVDQAHVSNTACSILFGG